MESRSPRATAVFRQQDLEALAGIAMMRLPLRAPEYRRLQRMRALLDAATELTRRLGIAGTWFECADHGDSMDR